MRKTTLLVCLFLLLPLAGRLQDAGRHAGGPPRPAARVDASAGILLHSRLQNANRFFGSGRYLEAFQRFQEGYEAAISAGEERIAARFLGNLGACRVALRQYREALESFDAGRRLAEAAGDTSAAGAMDANTSSVYEQMGELDAAAEYARRAAARLAGQDRARHLPKVLIQLASVRARQGRTREAAVLFAEGIEAAGGAGDLETCALGFDRLGEERLKRGDLEGAEGPLLEAWRMRKLHRLRGLETSYRNLGLLRLEEGDLRSAGALLDRALERPEAPRGLMPAWDVYRARGLVRMARGDCGGALEDLRAAVRLARAWRAGVSPADATRLSSEQLVETAYAALARAAAALYFRTGDRKLLREGFEAAEENRALSLRALVTGAPARRDALPPEYRETLERLQAVEAGLARRPREAAALGEVERLRAALVTIENRGGAAPPPVEPDLAARLERALAPDTAWFTFQLGEPESYVWAMDRSGSALYRLPGRARLAAAIAEFAGAVRTGGDIMDARGVEVYGALFGGVAPRFTGKPRWLLSLDEELFQLPVAALRKGGGYLAERHAIAVAPAAELAARAAPGAWTERLEGHFVGLGDPLYNTADERWHARRPQGGWPYGLLLAAPSHESVQLPRLVGSGREIELCAAAWDRPGTVLLTGARADKARLRAALEGRPAVVHLATHVLESAQRSRHGLIALALGPGRGSEILEPLEIAAWGARAGVVVLSGCSSGAGQALPGSGLMGLTRAWLASGAAAVAATRWPTPDGSGALLRAFYRHLREAPEAGAAAALARAQVEMLRSGGWRAQPRYWGAYFMVASQ